MPAILSHHLFGRTFLARENNRAFMTRDARDAFLLGNQGPDPLFFATRTPSLVTIKTLGSCMHTERIEDYLGLWREMLDRLQIKDHTYTVLRAYLYGFLCHYVLDRATHPLVHAYEEAICHAGVSGLDPSDRSFVHGQIEADLDVYLLYRLTGRTLEEYNIPKQVLYASDAVLSSIDVLYGAAAHLFDIKVPRGAFTRSIRDMRATVHVLYSPGGTKRKVIGQVERLVRPHSLLQAMSHQSDAHEDTWFANEENERWLHPQTREESTSSFNELFDTALETALADIKIFNAGVPVIEITKGLNFYGQSEHRPATDQDTPKMHNGDSPFDKDMSVKDSPHSQEVKRELSPQNKSPQDKNPQDKNCLDGESL